MYIEIERERERRACSGPAKLATPGDMKYRDSPGVAPCVSGVGGGA